MGWLHKAGKTWREKHEKVSHNFDHTESSDVLRTTNISFYISLSKRSGHNRKEKGESKVWIASGF